MIYTFDLMTCDITRGRDARVGHRVASVPCVPGARAIAMCFIEETARLQGPGQYFTEPALRSVEYRVVDGALRDPLSNNIIVAEGLVPTDQLELMAAELTKLIVQLVDRDASSGPFGDGWILLAQHIPPRDETVWVLRTHQIGGESYDEVHLAYRNTHTEYLDTDTLDVWQGVELVGGPPSKLRPFVDSSVVAWKRLPHLIEPPVPDVLRSGEWFDRASEEY